VLGVRNKEQLRDNLDSLKWKITKKEMEDLEKISSLPLNYPYWHQQKHN
jgi:aryl-alcohol dehydrogenase-like predicted oxidoreductase